MGAGKDATEGFVRKAEEAAKDVAERAEARERADVAETEREWRDQLHEDVRELREDAQRDLRKAREVAEDINDRLNTAVEWELDAIDVEWYLCEHDVEPRSQPEPSSGRDLHDILAQLGAGDGLDLDAEGREARELSEGMARRDAHERSEQIR